MMDRKSFGWEIAYYALTVLVYWLVMRDGPPLRVTFWYHTYRAAQAVARTAGSIGLDAEHAYHSELERSRT